MNGLRIAGYVVCGASGYLMGILMTSLEQPFEATLMGIGLIVLGQIGTALVILPRD